MYADKIWLLLEKKGIKGLNAQDISKETNMPFLECEQLFPTFSKVLEYLTYCLKKEVNGPTFSYYPSSEQELKDRLFEGIMIYLDCLQNRRSALQRFYQDLPPSLYVSLLIIYKRFLEDFLKQMGLSLEDKLKNSIQTFLLGVLGLYIFYIWLHDLTPDQEQTMRILDKRLTEIMVFLNFY